MKPIKQILAVIDEQKSSQDILKKSIELAEKFDAKIIILHTIHIPFLNIPAYSDDVPIDKEKIKDSIDKTVERLKNGADVDHYTFVYFGDSSERAIVEAKRDDIDLIITSSEMKFEKVIQEAHKPILVINGEFKAYDNILLPTDLSEKSKESIDFVKENFENSNLSMVYGYERIAMVTSMYDISYVDMMEYQAQNREISVNLLEDFEKKVGIKGELLDITFSLTSRLVDYIEEKNPDLVVVASRSGESTLVLGSVSSYVANASPNDVLIYC
ncbi:MAG: universal stress protein [Epsilonproteobacteria bacterium]|nr:universal stress protein [Campylobacterota bacterium]